MTPFSAGHRQMSVRGGNRERVAEGRVWLMVKLQFQDNWHCSRYYYFGSLNSTKTFFLIAFFYSWLQLRLTEPMAVCSRQLFLYLWVAAELKYYRGNNIYDGISTRTEARQWGCFLCSTSVGMTSHWLCLQHFLIDLVICIVEDPIN